MAGSEKKLSWKSFGTPRKGRAGTFEPGCFITALPRFIVCAFVLPPRWCIPAYTSGEPIITEPSSKAWNVIDFFNVPLSLRIGVLEPGFAASGPRALRSASTYPRVQGLLVFWNASAVTACNASPAACAIRFRSQCEARCNASMICRYSASSSNRTSIAALLMLVPFPVHTSHRYCLYVSWRGLTAVFIVAGYFVFALRNLI